jgi:ketosteroid isomerase-like protein
MGMKRILILGTLTAALMAFGAEPEATIKSVHAKFEAAINKKDFEAAGKIARANFSKDFVAKEGGHEENLDKFVRNMAPPQGRTINIHFELGKASVKGDTATLEVVVHFKSTMNDSGGKPRTSEGSEKDRETWKKIGGSWKMTLMETVTPPKKK